MSTFSILLGVVTWIIGFFMLLKLITEKVNKPQKWISLWLISTIIIGISYVSLISTHNVDTQFNNLFSYTTFSFIANFVASSFRLKYQFLIISAGTISLILSGIFIYYFQNKKLSKKLSSMDNICCYYIFCCNYNCFRKDAYGGTSWK